MSFQIRQNLKSRKISFLHIPQNVSHWKIQKYTKKIKPTLHPSKTQNPKNKHQTKTKTSNIQTSNIKTSKHPNIKTSLQPSTFHILFNLKGDNPPGMMNVPRSAFSPGRSFAQPPNHPTIQNPKPKKQASNKNQTSNIHPSKHPNIKTSKSPNFYLKTILNMKQEVFFLLQMITRKNKSPTFGLS